MNESSSDACDQGSGDPESLKFYNIFKEDRKTMELENEERIRSSTTIRPSSKVQVICKIMVSRNGSSVSYLKINASKDMSVAKLIMILRTKVAVDKKESIFLLLDDKLIPKSDATIGELAKDRAGADGCLHTA